MEISPDIFTADYVGEPGKRRFFLQARTGDRTRSFLVEKQQVALLAEKLRELLLQIDATDTIVSATPARDPALGLEDPGEPEFRVGTMGLAYDDDDDHVILFAQPVEEEGEPSEETGVRVLLRRDQVRALILHAYAIVDEGRPICQLCGLPMDPEGHQCPASNGHRRI